MDIVCTVPKDRWEEWLEEGDLPGEPWSGFESHFNLGGPCPRIDPGERVYVVSLGKLRGYAPLVRVERGRVWEPGVRDDYGYSLVRHGGAVAVTILEEAETTQGEAFLRPATIRGFRGWRYRWWEHHAEVDFPDWRTP